MNELLPESKKQLDIDDDVESNGENIHSIK